MKTSKMKTTEYIKEFIETQHSLGTLVDVYYIKAQSKALVYTNLTFRNATAISLKDLEEMLKPYQKRKINHKGIVNFNLKEVTN